jgi:arylsulfatase A-like enzyme
LLASAQTRRPPNIVFILADDLGYGDLGCYGQQQIQTPHLDRWPREGIRFTQAYAGATVCAPSRCCLMTGKHTGHATVRGNKRPELGLGRDEPTVASLLKNAGYSTALFGKWGLGGPGMRSVPNSHGFDRFYGYLDQLHAHNSYPEHLWDNENEVFLTENWFNRRKTFSNDVFTQKALEYVKAQDTAKPFFLYLAYTIPHANNERGVMEKMGMDVPDYGPYGQALAGCGEGVRRVDHADGCRYRARHEDAGRAGLSENTLIVFSSDNGPHKEGNHSPAFFESSGAVRGLKRDLYDGAIRVPGNAHAGAAAFGGQVSDAPWAFWDFLPTACSLAGVKPPRNIDGLDVSSTLLDGKPVARDHFYWEFHEGGFAQAVRSGDWKLVRQAPKLSTGTVQYQG